MSQTFKNVFFKKERTLHVKLKNKTSKSDADKLWKRMFLSLLCASICKYFKAKLHVMFTQSDIFLSKANFSCKSTTHYKTSLLILGNLQYESVGGHQL